MNPDALVLPQGLEDFAEARAIFRGRWGQVYEKTAFADLRNIGFILTAPCASFLISGQERLSLDGEPDLLVRAEDIVLIPPGRPFYTDFRHQDGPLRAYLFFFSRELVREFETTTRSSRAEAGSAVLCLRGFERMTVFMRSLDRIYAGTDADDHVVKLKLLELLHFLARQVGEGRVRQALRGQDNRNRPIPIGDVMQSDFAPELTVADYARIAGRPIASFNREFKRVFGMPPGKWLYREKMRRAADMLGSGDCTVTQVALRLGYQSTSHFIGRFRRFFGETPKQYQRRTVSENSPVSIR